MILGMTCPQVDGMRAGGGLHKEYAFVRRLEKSACIGGIDISETLQTQHRAMNASIAAYRVSDATSRKEDLLEKASR